MEEPIVRVRYKRLETTDSYCNVEIEAQVEHIVSDLEGEATIRKVIQNCANAVDAEIREAKKRKRAEIEAAWKASSGWELGDDEMDEDPDDDLDEYEDEQGGG